MAPVKTNIEQALETMKAVSYTHLQKKCLFFVSEWYGLHDSFLKIDKQK